MRGRTKPARCPADAGPHGIRMHMRMHEHTRPRMHLGHQRLAQHLRVAHDAVGAEVAEVLGLRRGVARARQVGDGDGRGAAGTALVCMHAT